jgi:hypothetical protein
VETPRKREVMWEETNGQGTVRAALVEMDWVVRNKPTTLLTE